MPDAVESKPRATLGVGVLLLATALTLNFLFERHILFESWRDLFFPAVCFLMFVTGIAVLVGGLVRCRIKQLLYFAFPIVVSLTILYIVFYTLVQFIQTAPTVLGECPGLYQAAAATKVIPESKWRPGRPALGCEVERRGMFLSYYNTIGVHGVTEAAEQQSIVDNVTEYRRRAHTHPVRVMFYEKENWTVRQGKNGVTSGFGGPEKLIRVVNIG
jgi:hypothetical protein